MKPRIAFFAAASLVATGMTLASNVSFGQRAGKFLADALDVMGPISSLVSGIVKPNVEVKTRESGDYAVSAVNQDSVTLAMRNQSMIPTNIVIGPSSIASPSGSSNIDIHKKHGTLEIQPGHNHNVPATLGFGNIPSKSLQAASLLSAFAKGAPGSLSKDREDVWQFLNSRPGQFDVSKLVLSEKSGRVDKEVLGTGNTVAPISGITSNDIVGRSNANNLTAQSLLSKNSVAPVPVPASSLVLVAGFASLFGVSLMAKKSKAKKSKKAAK
jgi:hypothetical protein